MNAEKIMSEGKGKIFLINANEVYKLLNKHSKKLIILDVREQEEVENGKIPTAFNIPYGYVESQVKNIVSDRRTRIIVYCASGVRSRLIAQKLKEKGFTHVYSLDGGFNQWKACGYPVERDSELVVNSKTDYFYKRYARHFRIPEIGKEGQEKLCNSKVLVIGAGGLGCPALLYLAAAGIGTLGIVDSDIVEETNLQRQILHFCSFIGRPKTESAHFTLKNFNPHIKVNTYQLRLNKDNILDIFKEYDLVIDGSDNFTTRYLINDACVFLKKPYIHGSIFRFEGQLTSFYSPYTACYRCLYPMPPSQNLTPNCEEAGVIGVLPGVIGVLQAAEAIKIILNIGDVLYNKLLYFNTLTNTFKIFKIYKNRNCKICAEKPSIKTIKEYNEFCRQL